jgi:hypothetical protein
VRILFIEIIFFAFAFLQDVFESCVSFPTTSSTCRKFTFRIIYMGPSVKVTCSCKRMRYSLYKQ